MADFPSPPLPSEPQDIMSDDGPQIEICLSHKGQTYTHMFPENALLADLADEVEEQSQIPLDNQKYIVQGRPILKAANDHHLATPLAELAGRKIMLMGSTQAAVASLHAMADRTRRRAEARERMRHQRRPGVGGAASHHRRASPGASTYTFLQLRPLPNLPHPARSLAFLQRLKEDPGVRRAMATHRFSVGLLTEMDPAAYTEAGHEGTTRVLGLNRNRGEVIELRLRTDAGDGYRDYRTIRRTLCHELAHNVHGPHDRAFWDLCRQIEHEVDRDDWKSGGRAVDGADGARAPARDDEDEHEHVDAGGWVGGEFRLGGGAGAGDEGPLTRREIIARAAEERLRRMNLEKPDGGNKDGGAGSSRRPAS